MSITGDGNSMIFSQKQKPYIGHSSPALMRLHISTRFLIQCLKQGLIKIQFQPFGMQAKQTLLIDSVVLWLQITCEVANMLPPPQMQKQKAPQPKKPVFCVITGKPAKYLDPLTRQPYSDPAAFQMLRQMQYSQPSNHRQKQGKNSLQTLLHFLCKVHCQVAQNPFVRSSLLPVLRCW